MVDEPVVAVVVVVVAIVVVTANDDDDGTVVAVVAGVAGVVGVAVVACATVGLPFGRCSPTECRAWLSFSPLLKRSNFFVVVACQAWW